MYMGLGMRLVAYYATLSIIISIQTKKYVPFVPSDKEVCLYILNDSVYISSAIVYNVVCD